MAWGGSCLSWTPTRGEQGHAGKVLFNAVAAAAVTTMIKRVPASLVESVDIMIAACVGLYATSVAAAAPLRPKHKMLQDLGQKGNPGGRRLGPVVSKRLVTLLTSTDPGELLEGPEEADEAT